MITVDLSTEFTADLVSAIGGAVGMMEHVMKEQKSPMNPLIQEYVDNLKSLQQILTLSYNEVVK